MWRHPENSSYLIYLKFSGLQKLSLIRADGNRRVFQALLQHCNLMGIGAATEGCVPAVPDSPWVLQGTRMLKDSGWICTVGEELGSIFLAGNRHTDGVLCHRNRGITYKTIKAQTGNMEDIARSKDNRRAIHCWRIVFGNLILVIKATISPLPLRIICA